MRSALHEIEKARKARDALDHLEQRRHGQVAAESVVMLLDDPDAVMLFARGLELEVDALLSSNQLARATARATEGRDSLPSSARRTVEAAVVDRVVQTATELAGDPVQALGRFADLARGLAQGGANGQVEHLRALQHTITAALRSPASTRGRAGYIGWAVKHGEPLADRLEDAVPADVAYFRHWAAIAEAAAPTLRPSASDGRVVDLLDRSLAGRPDTGRDLATRGMAAAERLLAQGERDRAIALFDATVRSFSGLLPRHCHSAGARLAARGLVVA